VSGKQNLIVTLLGRKGSGKTTLAKDIIPEFPRVVILDTNGEYASVATVTFSTLEPALAYLVQRSKDDAPFVMAYTPDSTPQDGLDFLRVVFEVPRILVLVDEAHMYCKANQLPDEISKLVRLGRHREISQLYIAQRPASLPRDITAQSDVVASFQQHEGRDIEYMAKLFGQEAEGLKTLARYRVVIYGDRDRAPLAILQAEAKKPLTGQTSMF
jgi:hypothetical protein